MHTIAARLAPLLVFACFIGTASAQQGQPSPNLAPGDAVVTGFSGTVPPPNALPRGKSAADVTFIDPDGASLRVFDASRPGFVWDARLFDAPKKFEALAKDVGQVFGVALDDATPPNIYVAATSVFGLNLVGRGRDGAPERRKVGGPGAGWMKGQFGLDLQGGPGAIYRIDGRTGTPTLFANVTLDGVPNPATGLGNLAYDADNKQLFVSDLHTGMIHRFDMTGRELGSFDHGVAGLGSAKLPTVAFNPRNRPNIASDRFDSEKPDSWGFAPAARRVWGLAVHDGRLYYSVLSGPQVWSIGLTRDGAFGDDPRWELDVPSQAGALPVTDIAFSHAGAMIVAQRAPIAAAYDYSAFTRPAEPQVLRFRLKGPDDPPSSGRWYPTPVEYPVGFAGNFRNSNGGVALGYGYGPDGIVNTGACEASLWATGQNLRNNPAMRRELEPGGPLVVHGVQASPIDMVRRGNEPPSVSYFVDYDGTFDDPRASGHVGSVRIYTTPCPAGSYAAPAPAIIPIGIGGGGNVCKPTCVCPNGGVLKDGKCVGRCEPPMVINPRTGLCGCPPGTALEDGKCVRIWTIAPPKCMPPLVLDPITGHCIMPPKCVPPLVLDPVTHTCVCPQGTVLQDRKCVPQICPAPLVPGPCECPEGSVRDGQLCITPTPIDLKIEKTGGTTPACLVNAYDFTISVTNRGAGWPGSGSIVVSDRVPGNMTFAPINSPPWSCLPLGVLTAGTPFQCTYNGPAPTANTPLPGISIIATSNIGPPFPPFTNCASVASTDASYADSDSSNNNSCTTVSKPSPCNCPDGQVLNADGICVPTPICTAPQVLGPNGTCICPAPTTPGAIPGQCICPAPNVMVNGVCTLPPPPICTPPMIQIPGGPCVCPQGSTLVDGACVPTPVCTPPQVPNAAGVCGCPPPMTNGLVLGQCLCPSPNVMLNGKCGPPAIPAPHPPASCTPPKTLNTATGACDCPSTMMDKGGVCVPNTDVCRPPKTVNLTTGVCGCPNGQIDKGGQCVPDTCVPPTHMNQTTGRCECAPGVVPQGKHPLLIQKILQLPSGKTWTSPSFEFDFVCTGPNSVTSSANVPIFYGNSGSNGILAPTCSQCTISERPQPVPANMCPPGTYATMLPATYSPSNTVVSGVGTDPVVTGFNIVNATNQVICSPTLPVCQPPLVLGPTGCQCPAGEVSFHGSCVNPDDHKRRTEQCEAGTKLINDICQPPPLCLPPQVANADGVCGCPSPMTPGAVPGQCLCAAPNVMVGGKCILRKTDEKKKTDNKPEPCPDGTHRVGKRCVKNESKEPRVRTEDVIRGGIDIMRGIGGGGGGGGGRNPTGGGAGPTGGGKH